MTALAATGCDGGGGAEVKGVLRLDGQPVEGAVVQFQPASASEGKYAYGVTGADGSFAAETDGQPGVEDGKYKIVIIKRGAGKGRGGPAIQATTLPAKYASLEETPFECTVPLEQEQLTLEMQGQAKK